MKLKNELISLVCVLAVLVQPVFFSVNALLGVEYAGLGYSNSYAVFVTTIFILNALLYVFLSVKKGVYDFEMKIWLTLLFVLFIHLFWVIVKSDKYSVINDVLLIHIVLGLPGFLAAAIVIKGGLYLSFCRIFLNVIALISASIIITTVIPNLAGELTRSLGGATYQVLSYYSAFSFGMFLYYAYLNSGPKISTSLSLLKQTSFNLLLVACAAGVLFGGGRGAFLLMIAYMAFTSFLFFYRKRSISSIGSSVLKLCVLLILVMLFIFLSSGNDFINSGFERATAYISSDGGIDISKGSSGRDVVYAKAIDFISSSGLFGYGPFTARGETILAHNIFLEIVLQYGLLAIPFSAFLLFYGFKGLRWSVKSDFGKLVLFISLYPATMLTFSGSYLYESMFWFCLAVFIARPTTKAGYICNTAHSG